VFSTTHRALVRSTELEHAARCVAFSHDGNRLAVGLEAVGFTDAGDDEESVL
jgi:hypothetical protein